MKDKTGPGRGWHGNSEGHRAAGSQGGRVSPGNFKQGSKRAVEAGRNGGKVSPGNFKHDPERARAAGRASGERRRARFTRDGDAQAA